MDFKVFAFGVYLFGIFHLCQFSADFLGSAKLEGANNQKEEYEK
jgi:hypothetical protein